MASLRDALRRSEEERELQVGHYQQVHSPSPLVGFAVVGNAHHALCPPFAAVLAASLARCIYAANMYVSLAPTTGPLLLT